MVLQKVLFFAQVHIKLFILKIWYHDLVPNITANSGIEIFRILITEIGRVAFSNLNF